MNYLERRLHCNVVHDTVGESCSLTIINWKCFYAITVVHTVGNSWFVTEQYLGNGSPSWSVNQQYLGNGFPSVTVTLYTMWKKVVLSHWACFYAITVVHTTGKGWCVTVQNMKNGSQSL